MFLNAIGEREEEEETEEERGRKRRKKGGKREKLNKCNNIIIIESRDQVYGHTVHCSLLLCMFCNALRK